MAVPAAASPAAAGPQGNGNLSGDSYSVMPENIFMYSRSENYESGH